MKTLNKEITEVLEMHNFYVGEITEQDNGTYIELHQHTPLGEDWWTTIWFDETNEGFIRAVREYYYSFDVDEEVEPFIEIRGQRGVPRSIRDLVTDAEWKEEKLKQLADDLEDLDLDFDEDDEDEDEYEEEM
jgi:hypothetical protein